MQALSLAMDGLPDALMLGNRKSNADVYLVTMTDIAMRISVHAHGLELRPELRRFVESRLSSSLSRFRRRIQLVSVNLAIGIREGLCLPTSCDVVATLRPSRDIHVRTEDVHLDVAIAKASDRLGVLLQNAGSNGDAENRAM
jgi:ribosome-associated translation inhibitor RaiA